MSGWSSASLDITGGWVTTYTEWHNWYYNFPKNKAPVRAVIFLKRNAAPFLEEERTEKIRAIEKGTLFDLLPIYVINVFDDWIAGLEHSVKFNDFLT